MNPFLRMDVFIISSRNSPTSITSGLTVSLQLHHSALQPTLLTYFLLVSLLLLLWVADRRGKTHKATVWFSVATVVDVMCSSPSALLLFMYPSVTCSILKTNSWLDRKFVFLFQILIDFGDPVTFPPALPTAQT